MLTKEYKEEMRHWMQKLFENKVSFLFNPFSINYEVRYDEKTNTVYAPIYTKDDFIRYFKDEGLSVEDKKLLYVVSIVC